MASTASSPTRTDSVLLSRPCASATDGVSRTTPPATAAPAASVREVNLTGMFLCTRAAVRLMKAQDPPGGRIINNGSISANVPRPSSVAYTATKHAVTGLTRAVALDGRAHGIAVGQVDVGNAATDMTAGIARGARQADGSVRPEATFDPVHVAATVVHIARLPLEVSVPFTMVLATGMPYLGRG